MPPPPRFLTATWQNLAMLNFETDPAAIASLVPAGTELDAWNGHTFLSVVGFRFLDTRVLGAAIPFHRNFDEVNLRFYVRRKAADGWRRGVVFVKELVPRRAIAWVARRLYNENYVALPMRHLLVPAAGTASSRGSVGYEWRHRRRWQGLRVDFSAEPFLPADDSLETFITEHYWGYVRQRDGGTVEYHVEHPRWLVWRAESATLDCDVEDFYGRRFAAYLDSTPVSAFVARGSPVTVRRGIRL
jgi:uncharacterized protein YqjF (DUF2071 family)